MPAQHRAQHADERERRPVEQADASLARKVLGWEPTVDFDTLGEKPELADTVTVRDRDSGKQERLSIADAIARVREAAAL